MLTLVARGRRLATALTLALLGTSLLALGPATTPAVAADAPALTALAWRSGPPAGGQLVRIRGHRLTGTTAVLFGGVSTTTDLQVVSDTEVVVRTPPHPVGIVRVQVVRPDATSPVVAVATYAYVAKPQPMVYGPAKAHPRAFVDDLSCTSATFCVTSARFDRGTASRPDHVNGVMTWNGTRWSAVRVFSHSLVTDVSCATSPRLMCMTVGLDGYASRFQGGRWTRTRIAPAVADNGRGLVSVSCGTSTSCLAVDATGNALRWNGSSWTTRHRVVGASTGFTDVSCPTSTWCYATIGGGPDGSALGTRYRNGRWDPVRPISTTTTGAATTISCTSPTFCLAAGQFRKGVYLVYTGITWSPSDVAGPAGLAWAPATCASPTFCVVPTAQDDFSYELNLVNGGYLGQQDGQQLPPGSSTQDPQIDCWAPYACLAINETSAFLTRRGP